MDSAEVHEIFELQNAETIYNKFKYQFFVTGLFDDIDDSVVIEQFLSWFSFEEYNGFFDEFSNYFKMFHHMYNKNEFIKDLYY